MRKIPNLQDVAYLRDGEGLHESCHIRQKKDHRSYQNMLNDFRILLGRIVCSSDHHAGNSVVEAEICMCQEEHHDGNLHWHVLCFGPARRALPAKLQQMGCMNGKFGQDEAEKCGETYMFSMQIDR